jgi:hypothetical protein
MFRRSFLLSYFLFLISYLSYSQTDSCHLRISLLTCSPGEELYSTFGHSALRVTDSVTNEDIVYNYGTFSFDEPGFYTKFIRGKLLYYLSTQDFISFKQDYEAEKRSMIEQVLNLSCDEKQKMVQLLHENLMGENKFYKYDFLFDNCTTRLRDLLIKTADSPVHFSTIIKDQTPFRQLIHAYLDMGDHQWSKLGIDLLLGAKTDAVMTNTEAMFLPDYLLKGFDSGRIAAKRVVLSKNDVISLPGEKNKRDIVSDPIFIFSLLFVVIILMSFLKNEGVRRFLYGFDGFLFFISGFAGIAILFMWFGTDHVMCRNNYNLLWAWPTHAGMAFFIHSKKEWAKKYFSVTGAITLLVLLASFFLPQQLNPAFIPIILLLIIRSIAYARKQKHTV